MTWIDRSVELVRTQAPVGPQGEAAICLVVARSGPSAQRLEAAFAAAFPDARLLLVVLDEGGLHHPWLAALGRFDVVVDTARGDAVRRRFRELVPHVRRGGCVVVRRTMKLADGFEAIRDGVGGPLGELVGEVELDDDFVVARVAAEAATKLVEVDMEGYLEAAGPDAGEVLLRVPAESWTGRGEVTGNDPARVADLPRAFDGPSLTLRAHEGAESHLQAAVLHRNVVLPDSYRRQHRARLSNHQLIGVARRAVLAPPPPLQKLDGTYLHLDNEWRGQFGHNLLEQVTRTWAWPHALDAYPDARVLVSRRPHTPLATWETDLLEAAGVPAGRLTVIDEPAVVERLLTATPAFGLPDRVHPLLADVYERIGAALAREAPSVDRPARVFFSRRTTRRRSCINAPEVEALFAEHGFEVLYPEDHPLAEQVALVRTAEVIGGFTGSGLYHLGLAGGPKRVVAIGSSSYGAVVEPCLAALMGHRLHQVWCDPVDDSGFQADFTFDTVRDGDGLRAVLAGDGA